MKTRRAFRRNRPRSFSFSQTPSKGRLALARPRRLGLEPLEDRRLLDGLGLLSGTVFEDLDRDGVDDLGEPGLAGWTVELQRADGDAEPVQTFLNPAPADGDLFGRSVAVADGTILVGVPGDDTGASDAGAAYLFDASGTLLRTYQKPGPAAGDLFGASVAVIGDKVLIGCPNDDTALTDAGAAYLFDGSTGTLRDTFLSPTPFPRAHFGASLSAVGSNVLIGCPSDSTGGYKAGAAYLFDGTTGELLDTFLDPTPAMGDRFGGSVAAAGNNVVIAADGDDTGAIDAGAVYLFDGSSGNLLHTFLKPTPASGDWFGSSLAATDNRVLVAAPEDDTGAENAGAAYLFDAETGDLLQTFLNPAPDDGDRFGSSLAAVSNTVLVGAAADDTGATDAGAAYLFHAPTAELLQTLLNPAPADGDRFGAAVAMTGGRLVVAAENDDTVGEQTGAVYGYVSSAISSSAVTNASGDYHFDGLQPGTYAIGQKLQAGYFQSSPLGEGTYTIVIGPGEIVFDVDFANYQNDVPVAHDDGYEVDEDQTLAVAAPGVLGNDVDLDELTASLVGGPSHGTLTLGPDGSFEYTPQPDFHGTDSFTYKAGDGLADSNLATVTITVHPINDTPVAADDRYRVEVDAELTVSAAGVLENDADVDGDPLSAVLVDDVSHGSLTLEADGSLTYVPQAGFRGIDSFTYAANDGSEDSNVATVTIVVGPGSLGGTVFDDLNRDRVWDPGEPGLEGWTVALDSTRETGDLLATILEPSPGEHHALGRVVVKAGNNFLVPASDRAVYLLDGTTGEVLQTFANPTPGQGDEFGDAIATFGDDVFIGAPRRRYYDTTPCGVVYRFDASTGDLLATYANPRPVSGHFGRSIAVAGNRVVIGAETTGAGIAHVFDASTMELLHSVESPNPQPYASFGKSAAAVGDDFLVSAPGEDRGQQEAGAAYLFDGSTWELLHTFSDPAPTEDGNFGAEVAVAGTTIAFGVANNNTGATFSGIVYLFDASTGNLLHTLVNPEPQYADGFGTAVAWLGKDLLVGTPFLAKGDS